MVLSLGEEINAATRSHHTALNQLLLRLLPLALPPHTSSPHLYSHGIAHFLPIYTEFESSFRLLLSHHHLLRRIYTPALERSARLQYDLECLGARIHPNPNNLTISNGNAYTPATHRSLCTFTSHIRSTLAAKPHLMLAYTWVFYMALFSGGRYMRVKLHDAGDDFWAHSSIKNKSAKINPPLRFWHFDGESDGEDLKANFKTRVQLLESALSASERSEIVAEAAHIMTQLLALVHEIESSTTSSLSFSIPPLFPPSNNPDSPPTPVPAAHHVLLLLKHLLPMGITELLAATAQHLHALLWQSKAQVVAQVPIKSS